MAVVKKYISDPSLKYKGYIIPKGATIFINVCELSIRTRTPALSSFQGAFSMTQVDLFCCSTCFSGPTDFLSALFDDPENFIPERYMLTEDGTKPGMDGSDLKATFPFGFGRVSPRTS